MEEPSVSTLPAVLLFTELRCLQSSNDVVLGELTSTNTDVVILAHRVS